MALGYPSEAFMHQAVRFMWHLLSSDVFSTKRRLIRACSLPSSLTLQGTQGSIWQNTFEAWKQSQGFLTTSPSEVVGTDQPGARAPNAPWAEVTSGAPATGNLPYTDAYVNRIWVSWLLSFGWEIRTDLEKKLLCIPDPELSMAPP